MAPQTKPYKDMKAKNMLLDFNTWPESGSELWPPKQDYPSGVRPYDVYNPEARDINWNYLNKGCFHSALMVGGWIQPNRITLVLNPQIWT